MKNHEQFYIDAELKLLRQAIPSPDPLTTAILEGVATLTGKIRQQLEETEIKQWRLLLEKIDPHLLQVYPSITVMQCVPKNVPHEKTVKLKKGTSLCSSPVSDENTSCIFTTMQEVSLNPIQITEFKCRRVKDNTYARWVFTSNTPLKNLDLQHFNLYLRADHEEAMTALMTFTAGEKCARVGVLCGEKAQPVLWCGEVIFKQGGFETQSTHPHRTPLLRDYFLFPQKFMFVSIQGLEKIIWPKTSDCFVLEMEFKNVPANLATWDETLFIPNAIPVMNVYSHHCEPFLFSPDKTEYPLVVDNARPRTVILDRVDEVIGVDPVTQKKTHYQSLMADFPSTKAYYRAMTTQEEHPHTRLFLIGNQKNTEMISCQAIVTNGDYPHHHQRLAPWMIGDDEIQSYFLAKNLHHPTPSVQVADENTLVKQWISLMHLSQETLWDVINLKQWLYLHMPTRQTENYPSIESLQKITTRAIDTFIRGIYTPGIEVEISFDETIVFHQGEIYLFASVLHHFFAASVPIHRCIQTRAVCYPSGCYFLWKSSPGTKNII